MTMEKYIFITFGATIQGMAMAVFLFPNNIPSGGAGGLAVIFHFLFDLPLSISLWMINFTMLIIAIHWLGGATTFGTIYGITITSLSIQFFQTHFFIPATSIWFDLIIGSVLLGLGAGILLRQQVSNGGMGVLALVFSNYLEIPPGKPLFIINGFIFILMAFIIDWKIIFLAFLSQWLSTRIVDIIYNINIIPPKQVQMAWRKK
ncbi:YitT family protein [Bacillus tamaricis]|uniref:YitT family protein n=2 Tax=Evansella tamaricis TaxID=2069301 RepID=A0ABS6JK70_9BACI|nr:YitT family protein [Evansella tamaricis]